MWLSHTSSARLLTLRRCWSIEGQEFCEGYASTEKLCRKERCFRFAVDQRCTGSAYFGCCACMLGAVPAMATSNAGPKTSHETRRLSEKPACC